MTDIQRALLKAGLVDKKKISDHNSNEYLKRKKEEAQKKEKVKKNGV